MLLCGRTNGVNGAIFRLELPKRHVNTNISMQGAFSLGPGLERALSLQIDHHHHHPQDEPTNQPVRLSVRPFRLVCLCCTTVY